MVRQAGFGWVWYGRARLGKAWQAWNINQRRSTMKRDLLEVAREELDDKHDLDNLTIGVIVGTTLGLVVWLSVIWSFAG